MPTAFSPCSPPASPCAGWSSRPRRRRPAAHRPAHGARAVRDGAGARPRSPPRPHADPDASHADQVATDPKHAPAFMAHAMLAFNEQIERIGEVVAVMAVGMLLWAVEWRLASWGFVAALLLVIRPVSVAVGLIGSSTSAPQRGLIGWFGIRGIGSLYYLTYAMNHGLGPRARGQPRRARLLDGGRVDRRPRRLGDAADGDLRAHQGAPGEGLTRPRPARSRPDDRR